MRPGCHGAPGHRAESVGVSVGTHRLVLLRHGETEWSKSGQHTSTTDLELTEHGREQATLAALTLDHLGLADPLVVCSPRKRALDTAELAGLTVDEVQRLQADGYRPTGFVERDPELAEVLELIVDGTFTHGDTDVLRPLVDNLLHHDPFLVLADYRSYVDCQARVSAAWQDADSWSRMSILNAARSGKFSSDRAIAEYSGEIWHVGPMPVTL